METILVVEDEPLELTALCGNVRRIYGETVNILTAEDGLDALEICKERTPDVALIDINIPGISGLDLIQALKDQEFPGKIMIITAYDASDYIRQALSLGVIDYLLKPIHTKELQRALEKCFRLLNKDREQKKLELSRTAVASYAEQYLIHDILSGAFPKSTLENAYGWNTDGKLQVCAAALYGVQLPDDGETVFHPYFRVLSGEYERVFLLLLYPQKEKPEAELLVKLQVCAGELWKQLGKGTVMITGFCSTYRELLDNLQRTINGIRAEEPGCRQEQLAADALADKEALEKMHRKWEQRLREGNVERFIRMFRRRVSESGRFWEYVSLLFMAVSTLDPSVDLRALLELLEQDKPYAQLEHWLQNYCKGREKGMIDFAISWMEEHCSEEISRQMVADKLGLTETYFSSLFKRETNQKFVSMLNKIRIDRAKKMLDGQVTDMDAVAKACGFYNRKYFFEVFKRFAGCSITDYKKEERK